MSTTIETNTNESASENGPRTLKGFRNSVELETFYRFVYENDLRREAKLAIEMLVSRLSPKKKGRGRKSQLQ